MTSLELAARYAKETWEVFNQPQFTQPNQISFPEFFSRVFADFLTSPSSPHQTEALEELSNFHTTCGQRFIRLEPRGFAKTLRSQAFVCYCIGYGLESFILWLSN